MANAAAAQAGCLVVGEYVDEAEVPANLQAHRGEPVRPRMVASYLDLWGREDSAKEFTVLLKDGRVVVVRGHGLKQFPASVPGESGSYAVVVRSAGEEVLVALFPSSDVVGIFHGELRSDRKIA
jgi:hypothetical protein